MIIGKFFLTENEMKKIIDSKEENVNEAILKYYEDKDNDSYNYASIILEDNKDFKVIVDSKEELQTYLEFFSKHKLNEDNKIKFRTHSINSIEIYDILRKYKGQNFTNDILVNVDNGYESIDYNKFMKMMNPLNKIESNITSELSPLEKIALIYNEIKKNQYKNDIKNPRTMKSRLLSEVLTNEEKYIVCVGFTKYFNESLRINNIKCSEYNFEMQITEELATGHSVSLVNIDDDKYDVHGIYVFDPTVDCYKNNLSDEKNSMNYKGFLMSFEDFKLKYNVSRDNYFKLFYNSSRKNEMYAKNKEQIAETKFVGIFDDDQKMEELSRFVELDYDLFDGMSNIDVDENLILQESKVYNYAEFVKSSMGNHIASDSDTFIDLIYNISAIDDQTESINYVYNSIDNRGVDNNMNALNRVKQKIR